MKQFAMFEVVKIITLALVELNCAETLVTKHQLALYRAGRHQSLLNSQQEGSCIPSPHCHRLPSCW